MARIPLLALRGISKRFGAVQALSHVDLEINEGEVVALVGDKGAGKSTLVKAIAGVSPPDSGVIEWKSRPIDPGRCRLHTVGAVQGLEVVACETALRSCIPHGLHDPCVWTAQITGAYGVGQRRGSQQTRIPGSPNLGGCRGGAGDADDGGEGGQVSAVVDPGAMWSFVGQNG